MGLSCFTPFFLAGRGLGRGFVRPSYLFIQMLGTSGVATTLYYVDRWTTFIKLTHFRQK